MSIVMRKWSEVWCAIKWSGASQNASSFVQKHESKRGVVHRSAIIFPWIENFLIFYAVFKWNLSLLTSTITNCLIEFDVSSKRQRKLLAALDHLVFLICIHRPNFMTQTQACSITNQPIMICKHFLLTNAHHPNLPVALQFITETSAALRLVTME